MNLNRLDSALQDLLAQADLALRQQDRVRACRLLDSAIQLATEPKLRTEILLNLAIAESAQNNWREAADAARRALREAPSLRHKLTSSDLLCKFTFQCGGSSVAADAYASIRPYVVEIATSSNPSGSDLDHALRCAIAGGDKELCQPLFSKWAAEERNYRAKTSVARMSRALPAQLSPVTSTAAWAEQRISSLVQLEAPERFTGINGPSAWDYTSDGFDLVCLSNAEVLSGWDFVVTETGEVLSDVSYWPIDRSPGGWFKTFLESTVQRILHPWPASVETLDVEAVFLSCPPNFHVGHWLVDYLPRLRALSAYPDAKIIIPDELPARLREYLSHFGVTPDYLIECTFGKRYRVRSLIVARYSNALRPSMETVLFVGDALKLHESSSLALRRRFLLIRDRQTRSIRNRDELNTLLDRFGFETLALSAMSLADQQRSFAEAEVVIATYGSDLLAYYFMSERSTLIELNWNPATLNASAAQYCSFLGVNYYCLVCTACEGGIQQHRKDSDFVVDLQGLETLLIRVCSTDAQGRG